MISIDATVMAVISSMAIDKANLENKSEITNILIVGSEMERTLNVPSYNVVTWLACTVINPSKIGVMINLLPFPVTHRHSIQLSMKVTTLLDGFGQKNRAVILAIAFLVAQ